MYLEYEKHLTNHSTQLEAAFKELDKEIETIEGQ